LSTDKENKSILATVLSVIARAAYRRPILFLVLSIGLAVGCSAYAAARLELRMDWTYLFEPDDPLVQRVDEAREIFPLPGDIVVMVDQGSKAQREAFLDRLAQELEKQPELFHNVLYRVDLAPIAKKALFYLDESQLKRLRDVLSPSGGEDPLSGQSLELALHALDALEKALRTRGRAPYQPLWTTLASESNAEQYLTQLLSGEEWVYTTIGDGKVNVLAFHSQPWGAPAGVSSDPSIKRIRQILDEFQPTTKDIRVRLTGLPVMLYDERKTCTEDGIRSGIISVVAITIIFAIGFGEITRPIQAVTALMVGLGWSLGFTTLAVGHLNFITVSLMTMLMGLGIDFGIHLLFRFDEELGRGFEGEEALVHTMNGTGVDTLVGATATAVAFLALTQADFRGIAEFGIIASGGVLLCFLSTIVVLPSMLSLFPGKPRPPISPEGFLAWFEKGVLQRAGGVVGLSVVLLALGLFYGSRVGFSYNLLEVQAANLDSVKTEKEMVSTLRRSVLSGQVLVEGEEQARQKLVELQGLSTVSGVGSILTILPKADPRKAVLVQQIVNEISGLQLPQAIPLETADDLRRLQTTLTNMEANGKNRAANPQVRSRIETIKELTRKMGPGPVQEGLSQFQDDTRKEASGILDLLRRQVAEPPTTDDLPPALVIRSLSPTGHYKLSVSAKKNIWEKDNLLEFLAQTRTVDPDMVGHPVVQAHILEAFDRAFRRTPWYTLAGVLLVMAVYLRNLRAILLSLLPTATGVIFIFGVMGLVGLSFNVVNFVALPMSVGIGAVYGVHSLHRMREQNSEELLSSSTGPAILLSGMTTVAGFSTLMTANHRGLSSLGFVISVGVAVNFLASLVLLPALRRVIRRITEKNPQGL